MEEEQLAWMISLGIRNMDVPLGIRRERELSLLGSIGDKLDLASRGGNWALTGGVLLPA